MAKASATAGTARGAKPGKRRGGSLVLLGVLTAAGFAVAYPALAAFLLVGLAPTLVAKIVETPSERHLTKCVGLLNLAGVLPVAVSLAKLGFTMPGLARLLADATNWAAMYGAAAAGWGLHLSVATLSVTMARRKLERQNRLLALRQKQLIHEWGPEVAASDTPA